MVKEQVETTETEPKKEFSENKVINIIVEKVLQSIEDEQKLPWHQTWLSGQMNYFTGKPYSGVNTFLLINGCGEYMTFKQMLAYNKKHKTDYRLKPSETKKYYIILIFKPLKKFYSKSYEDSLARADGRKIFQDAITGIWYSLGFVKKFTRVWGINQMEDSEGNSPPSRIDRTPDGSDDTKPYKQYFFEGNTLMHDYMKREGIRLTNAHGQRAFYRQEGDLINMPKQESFTSDLHYLHVLFHESIHSTGVQWRLNRKSLLDYSNSMEVRGLEELVAEIGASHLMVECGVDITEHQDIFDNSVAYLQGWSTWIKDNKSAFVMACSLAVQAMEFITNVEEKTDEESQAIAVSADKTAETADE